HGVIELEAGFDFSQGVLADFDVQAQVVGLGELVDLVSQLTAAPVFNTVNLATGGGDQGLVALEHGRHLFALIRVDQHDDFVVTHGNSLWIPVDGSRREASNPQTARAAPGFESLGNIQVTCDYSNENATRGWRPCESAQMAPPKGKRLRG